MHYSAGWTVYTKLFVLSIRIVLANIEKLYSYISELEKCISVSQVEKEYVFSGEIQGHLDIGRYTQRLANYHFPREYPCIIKTRSFVTPENVYVIFIIKNIINLLKKIQNILSSKGKPDISELGLVKHYITLFKSFSIKPYFRECLKSVEEISRSYGDVFPEDLLNLIFQRTHKGKIRNSHIYKEVFTWYDIYKQGSLLENDQKINILRYSEEFSNRFFELWSLFNIKKTFIDSFGAVEIDTRNLMDTGDGYVFKLAVPTGGTVEIYYQKGSSLYWTSDDDLAWKYCKGEKNQALRGIPDISICYTAKKRALVMIDIKNRVRGEGTNSEEIYKMIGYFSNFKKTFEERFDSDVKKQGALIFRNDAIPCQEYLESNNGYRLMTLSAGVSRNSVLNQEQFKKLCKYVLDVQGIDGTTAELMGGFNFTQKKIQESFETNPDDFAYRLTHENDSEINRLFANADLEKQLPGIREQLQNDHFPHVWNKMSEKSKKILSMAECLYAGVSDCNTADYAPICLEYCRAIEVEINELIFTPFRTGHDIERLALHNRFYEKLNLTREMTLGECVYLLDKCSHRKYPLSELKAMIQSKVKHSNQLFDNAVSILRNLNESIRRLSAHTTVMDYDDLVSTRQQVLGIGNLNLFYVMLDER